MVDDNISPNDASSGNGPNYDDWEIRDPTLADLTLEEVIRRGETLKDSQGDYSYVSLNACPWWLAPVVATLKGKHGSVRSESAVERHLIKLGLAILSREEGLSAIREAKKAIASGLPNLMALLMFAPRSYTWGDVQSRIRGRRRNCSLYRWSDGLASDCASILNLPKAPVVTLGLMYGASRSELWVPEGYRKLAVAEVRHFQRWLLEWWAGG